MGQARKYDQEYKVQAVKLARKVGTKKAAEELGIPSNTLSGWIHNAKIGRLDLGRGEQAPQTGLTLAAENEELRKQLKEREKEVKRLKEENEFLKDASAFFAASHWKLGKTKE